MEEKKKHLHKHEPSGAGRTNGMSEKITIQRGTATISRREEEGDIHKQISQHL